MPLPTYLMSNFPSVRPSLNLQFDSQPTPEDMTSHLASVGATFSRASIGTYTDANGIIQEATSGQARPNYSTAGVHEGLLIEESRTNLAEASEDFSTTDWTTSNSSIIVNQAISPDGTASADKLIANTNNTNHYIGISSTTVSGALCCSVFAKADEYNFIRLRFNNSTQSGRVWFNLSSGTVGTTDASVDASIEDYGDGWYRCIAVESGNTSTFAGFQIFPQSADNQTTYAGDGESGVLIWGAQFEEGSFPTSYIPTIPTFTSRASDGTYFDSSGVLQTTSGERIDHKYIDGQWVEAGLLLEGASTNLVANSNTSDWSVVRGTRGSATTFATNINGYVYSATSTSPNINKAFAGASTGDYVFSVYVDATNSDEFDMRFAVDGNASNGVRAVFTPSTESFGSITENTSYVTSGSGKVGFEKIDTNIYRLYISADFTAGTNWFPVLYYEDNATNVAMGGFQIEAGTQPSSLIQTSGSSATRSADVYTTATKQRSADVCYIDGTAFTDFYNEDEGTVFLEAINGYESSSIRYFSISDGTNNNRISATAFSNGKLGLFISDSGVTQVNDSDSVASPMKISYAIKTDDFAVYANGSSVLTDTSGSLPTVDRIYIGGGANGGLITKLLFKRFIYFPRRLGSVGNNAELIKLTQ